MLSFTDVEDYEEVYELVQCQLDKAHFPLDVAKFCLSLMDKFKFSAHHILRIKVNEAAFDASLDELQCHECRIPGDVKTLDSFKTQLLQEALTYGCYLTEAYEQFGGLWNKRGINHARVSTLPAKLGRSQEARQIACKANRILKITRGQEIQLPEN